MVIKIVLGLHQQISFSQIRNILTKTFWFPKLCSKRWETYQWELYNIQNCLARDNKHSNKNCSCSNNFSQEMRNTQSRTFRCPQFSCKRSETCTEEPSIVQHCLANDERETLVLPELQHQTRSSASRTFQDCLAHLDQKTSEDLSSYRRRNTGGAKRAVKSPQITLIGVVFDIGRQGQTQRDLTGSERRPGRRWVILYRESRTGMVARVIPACSTTWLTGRSGAASAVLLINKNRFSSSRLILFALLLILY